MFAAFCLQQCSCVQTCLDFERSWGPPLLPHRKECSFDQDERNVGQTNINSRTSPNAPHSHSNIEDRRMAQLTSPPTIAECSHVYDHRGVLVGELPQDQEEKRTVVQHRYIVKSPAFPYSSLNHTQLLLSLSFDLLQHHIELLLTGSHHNNKPLKLFNECTSSGAFMRGTV